MIQRQPTTEEMLFAASKLTCSRITRAITDARQLLLWHLSSCYSYDSAFLREEEQLGGHNFISLRFTSLCYCWNAPTSVNIITWKGDGASDLLLPQRLLTATSPSSYLLKKTATMDGDTHMSGNGHTDGNGHMDGTDTAVTRAIRLSTAMAAA